MFLDIKRLNKRKIGITTGVVAVLGGIGASMFAGVWLGDNNKLSLPESEISFVANNNLLYDASFNQGTLTGTERYGKEFGVDVKSYTPSGETVGNDEYKNIFSTVKQNGSKGILNSGFSAETAFLEWLENNKETYGIHLDSGAFVDVENAISVQFRAEESGFAAGVATALYTYHDVIKNPEATGHVTTWGGGQFPTVYDFMSGWEQAINWFNEKYLGIDIHNNVVDVNAPLHSSIIGTNLDDGVKIANSLAGLLAEGNEGYDVSYSSNPTDDNSEWFTGGNFAPGPGEQAVTYMENGDIRGSVMFPVAGGQVNDVMNYSQRNDLKVIGVDTDLTLAWPEDSHKEKILGSATKELEIAAVVSMWWAERWTNMFEQNLDTLLVEGTMADAYVYSQIVETIGEDTSWIVDDANDSDFFTHNHFIGSYQNGGVDFSVDDGSLSALTALETFNLNAGTDYRTLSEFIDYAFSQQPNIEKASKTFIDNS